MIDEPSSELTARRWRAANAFVTALWVIAVLAATAQQGVLDQNNNFLIFRAASLHLLHDQDLYAAYPTLHTDFYKYSPTFALLFLPFAALPFALSMLVWNAVNAGVLYVAIGLVLPRRGATVARGILFLDMLGSLQNVQSNALVTGLIILAFAGYERRHTVTSSLAAGVGTAIKLFPLAAVTFAIFHPRKGRVALAVGLGMIALLLVPLLVTPPNTLAAQYASWQAIQTFDAMDRGMSVMRIVEHLVHGDWPNWPLQLGGVVALVAPVLARRARWGEWEFRRLYLCSVLLFCVIFNHKSESPSFVIAVAGAALWFAARPQWARFEWTMFAFFMVCTVLASSDLMPVVVQREFFDRYQFKVVPCVVLWLVVQRQLWRRR